MESAHDRPDQPSQHARLRLSVHAEQRALVLDISNRGDTVVRVWQQGNSWGWPTARIYLSDTPEQPATAPLTPAARVWTRNFPSVTPLAPGESVPYRLGHDDLDPEGVRRVAPWREQVLWVLGELACEPTPEAVEQGVWCGTMRSDLTRLDPPHRWLEPP